MKILSFDVGIKNLAICLLETNDNSSKINTENSKKNPDQFNQSNNVTILDWQLLDLSRTVTYKCVFKKKKSDELCGLNASYRDSNNNCYCKRHAKSTEYLIPDTKLNTNQLKRNSLKKLNEILEVYNIKNTLQLKTKDQMIDAIEKYKKNHFLSAI
jgi:hypothetical protein